MNKFCDYKPCQYYTVQPGPELRAKMQPVKCPLCLNANYCGNRCRDLDWTCGHKSLCKMSTQTPDRSRSCNDYDESVSTMSARRRPEEFEVVQVGKKSELGRGSYGCVKLVKDKTNGKLYAMKMMNKRQVLEYCTVDNLKREIKIQRRLQHVHICKLYHYFEDKENVYLILEYAESGSLFNYIKKRTKLPENESFVYFFQTCLGIDYLHKNKIIHRDLKPENLLLDHEGNVKICDFGWSAESLTEKRTTFCGTYEYMAPEMLNKQPHDFSLDIWSLGILLFELIHGYAPYRGRNNEELCQKIKSGTPILFAQNCSLDAQNLIRRILRYNPIERLTMNEIFDHPWMQKHSKEYNIEIWSYVYKSSQPMRQIPPPISQRMQNQDLKKEIAPQRHVSDYAKFKTLEQAYGGKDKSEDFSKPRISRVSNRNEIMMHQQQIHQQQEQQLGFMDRVFLAFGCLNREKR